MPTPVIANGLYPRRIDGPDGSAYFTAWLSGDGSIQICFKPNANAAWSAPVAVLDETGAALAFADGGFDLSVAYSGQASLVLTATATGETGPREWASHDGGLSFEAVG